MENRQPPARKQPLTFEECNLLVVPAKDPSLAKVFSDTERPLAEAYAAEHDAVVKTLPLTD